MFRCNLIIASVLVMFLTGCPMSEPATFTMKVVPEQIEDTIPQQRCVLLVTIEESDADAPGEPVTITAIGEGATAVVAHGTVTAGEVAEVTVTMLQPQTGGEGGWPCSATIHAQRGATSRNVEVPIVLTSEEEDTVGPAAAEMRDRFVPWLAQNRPELGIDETTVWEGTIVKPHWLVVTHYLFFSDEWEMHVSWHVMIAPYDWARIDLRRRFHETLPSLAFEISSVSDPAPLTVDEIQPEEILWR